MRAREAPNAGGRLFVLVFETGDEVTETLLAFARERQAEAAWIQGIGAFSRATLGYFDPAAKDYLKTEVEEQVEVLALHGNLTLHEGEPRAHLHAVLGTKDGSTLGGHLIEAHVRPTLEMRLEIVPMRLERRRDLAVGADPARRDCERIGLDRSRALTPGKREHLPSGLRICA